MNNKPYNVRRLEGEACSNTFISENFHGVKSDEGNEVVLQPQYAIPASVCSEVAQFLITLQDIITVQTEQEDSNLKQVQENSLKEKSLNVL